ncbi:MAG TPA: nuclear transport factor 2 family protein, partial [Pyrinomonadaceae bacterium]|nr:nuclear transport factor 2 family protein [Pyrinomonadaceae bacterium]
PYTSNTNDDDGDDSDLSGLDRQTVMTELSKVENDWIRANIKADKKALERILADEYRGVAGDGTAQTKEQYLATIQPDRTARSWASEDVKLDFEGDKAVISGVLIWNSTDGTRRYRFADSFVKRDGRWQAVSSVTSPDTDN